MTTTKHTPGPWKVVNGFHTNTKPQYHPSVDMGPKTYRKDGAHAVIVVNESHDQEAESIMANAYLIAAAPELYEALLQCAAFIENGGSQDEFFACREAWRNAIEKATGS